MTKIRIAAARGKMNLIHVACAALCLVAALCASAKPGASPASVDLTQITPAQLAVTVDGWQDKFDHGDVVLAVFREKSYVADLAKLQTQLSTLESWEHLDPAQRLKLVNLYESLRARTEGGEAAGNQRRCSEERKPGSHLRSIVCVTAAEQRRADKLNSAAMSDIERNGRRMEVRGE